MLQRVLSWWKTSGAWTHAHKIAWAGQDVPALSTGLTPFQQSADRVLVAALREAGIELESRVVRGNDERFIEARFQNGTWTVWIYKDGAEARSTAGASVRLEQWDARTPDELIARFVEGVMSRLPGPQN